MDPVNPYSTEMVKAVVRRLAAAGPRLFLSTQAMRAVVQESLGLDVEVAGPEPAEAAFCPLVIDRNSLTSERIIVGALHNAISYKSLMYPGAVRTAAPGMLTRVRRHYQVEQVVGLYPPRMILLLALAHLARRWSSPAYFRLSDRSMQYLYEFGPMWRFSYIVVFSGHR
jgi:hypothetical protein